MINYLEIGDLSSKQISSNETILTTFSDDLLEGVTLF